MKTSKFHAKNTVRASHDDCKDDKRWHLGQTDVDQTWNAGGPEAAAV